MKVACVLFDLDGTLLDTIADLAAACNYALSRMGAPLHTQEEVRGMVGDGVRKLMERALPAARISELETSLAHFRTYYAAHSMDATAPYAGIPALLSALRNRGIKLGIVSNKPQYAVSPLARRFFPDVAVAVGDGEGRRVKPAPDGCLAALAELGAEVSQCVYIGDSDVDLATAEGLGVPCIAAAWGFRGKEFLLSHGARYLAQTPSRVLAVLDRIEREEA